MEISELWRPVLGFSQLYEVSSEGRIRSIKRGTPKLLNYSPKRNGYIVVKLASPSHTEHRLLHRIVLESLNAPLIAVFATASLRSLAVAND